MKRLAPLLALLILPLLCAPAAADYGCWPFGGVDQLIFPSCTTSGGHRSYDVNVTGGVAPAPVGTQQVDLVKVGGVAFAQGQRTSVNSLSVVPASDATFSVFQPDVRLAGQTLALQTLNAAIATPIVNGASGMTLQIVGLTGQSATVAFELSSDGGTTWVATNANKEGTTNSTPTATTDGIFNLSVAGHTNARVRVSVAGNAVNATVSYSISVGPNLLNAAEVGTWTVTVSQPGTATITSVASSASSVQLLAANTSRKGYIFCNESNQIAYVAEGATATSASGGHSFALTGTGAVPYSCHEVHGIGVYTGVINAIWASANGNMSITEEQ